MCAPGYWFTLEPLHKDFLELWKSKDNVVPWILHAVTEAGFVRPSYHLPKDKVDKLFGVGEGAIFTDVSSVVRHGSTKYIPQDTR